MSTESNFIALVPSFKFERGPTFVLACDVICLRWLRERFLEISAESSFVIGEGVNTIVSDDMCRMTMVAARGRESSEIRRSDQSNFIWRVNRSDAVVIADMLLALITSNVPRHQYLEVARGRYRTVVVTKDEYPVDTIRAMRDRRAPVDVGRGLTKTNDRSRRRIETKV